MRSLTQILQEGLLATDDVKKEIKYFNAKVPKKLKILKVDDDNDIYTCVYNCFLNKSLGAQKMPDIEERPIAIQPQVDGNWKISVAQNENGIPVISEYDIKQGYLRKAIENIRYFGCAHRLNKSWIADDAANRDTLFLNKKPTVNYRDGNWDLFKKYFS